MAEEQKEPTVKEPTVAAAEPSLDAAQVQYAVDRLRSQQNLAGGVLAGALAALAGAAAWAGITVATGYQIGWMAVGIGFLVGAALRFAGKGVDKAFGVAGAVLALLGCIVGNLLAVCGLLSKQESIPFFTVLSRLDVGIAFELMRVTFSPIDLLFYAIAVYEGYKLSFRRITEAELAELAREPM